MATYYVNLSLAGVGGDGSSGNPWRRDSFIAQVNGLQPAGTIFKIQGMYEYSTAITIKCPGENNSVEGYTLTSWNSYWGVSSSYAGPGFVIGNNSSGYHARNIISNCLLNANSVSCYDAVGLYGCFITLVNDINILGTSYGGTAGTSSVKGSTIASSVSKGLVLSADTNLIDSIIYSPLSISPTAGTFTSRNCVFRVAPTSGTHSNYQIGWSGTTIPVWSIPPASYVISSWGGTLNYGTIGIPPNPGYGIYNYTDYPWDLSGQSRRYIGAYSLPTNVFMTWTEGWPQVKNITANTASMSFKFRLGEPFPAVGHFVIVPRNAYTPTVTQIKSGKDSLNNSVPYGFSGYQSMINGDTEYLLSAVNLAPVTAYDAYFNMSRGAENITYKVQFQTLEVSPYYVDLNLTGTGGDGSVNTPWHADTFANQVNGLKPAGSLFKIKGSHVYTSTFTVKCPGTDSSIGYTFTNWDGSNPWRISAAVGAGQEIVIGASGGPPYYHAKNVFKNGVLNATNFYIECYDAAEFYDCYLKMGLYLYVYGTSAGGAGGNTLIKGCSVVSTSGGTYGIRTSGPNALTNLYDSIISAPLSVLVAAPALLTSTNCVFVTNPTTGTHTNYQSNWTPPTWPAWDASKELFAKSLLNYSTIDSPPSPGVGTPDYTGYPTNLWNQPRNNLGVYYDLPAQISSDSTAITVTFGTYSPANPSYPTFYYVDINNDYSTTGVGTPSSPYNYSQFIAGGSSATYRLKGSRNLDSTALIRGNTANVGNVEAWDPLLYGPWRIKSTSYFNYNAGQIVPGYMSGGIVDCLYASVVLRVMSNMLINTQQGLTFQAYNGGTGRNVNVYGSTFNCNTDMTADVGISFNDCIFDSSFYGTNLSNGTYNNCVLSMADWTGGAKNNCQFSWTPPIWPSWDAPKEFFYKSDLNFSTIATPPHPGYGYPDYAGVYFSDYGIGNFPGYNLNLWGNVRDDIGIFYSDPNPLDGMTLVANLPELNFQGSGCTLKIQDVGKQERTSIFQRGILNLGINAFEILAANDSTFQYNNLLYGSYDTTCGTLKVGADALSSDFSIYNGLGNYSIKAYDGTTHNATGKFTEYFQKSRWDCSGNWSFGSRHNINYIPGNCYLTLKGDSTLTSNGKFFNFVEISAAPDSTVILNDNFKCHGYKKTVGTLNANGKKFEITGDFQSPVNF